MPDFAKGHRPQPNRNPMTKRTIRSSYAERQTSVPMAVGAPLVWMAVVVAAIVAFTFLGLWLYRVRVNTEGEVRRESFNFQQTAREQVVDFNADLADIDAQLADPNLTAEQEQALTAQRRAVADLLCDVAADITGTTSNIVNQITQKEC